MYVVLWIEYVVMWIYIVCAVASKRHRLLAGIRALLKKIKYVPESVSFTLGNII